MDNKICVFNEYSTIVTPKKIFVNVLMEEEGKLKENRTFFVDLNLLKDKIDGDTVEINGCKYTIDYSIMDKFKTVENTTNKDHISSMDKVREAIFNKK